MSKPTAQPATKAQAAKKVTKASSTKKTTSPKAPATKAPAKKTTSPKAAATKAPAAKAAAPKKTTSPKAAATKSTATKAPAKKATPATKAPAAKKTTSPKAASTKPAPAPVVEEITEAPVRSRDDWNDLNRELFIERAELRAKMAELQAGTKDPAAERELRRLRRRFDDVTYKIVDSNFGLVRRYVKRFTSNASRDDIRDFESAATVGLMRAIETYDYTKGRFAQWAFKPIQREVLRAVHHADHSNMNAGDFERRPEILRAMRELQEGDESVRPPIEAIAAKAGVTVDQAKRVLFAPRFESTSAPVGDGSTVIEDLIEERDYNVEDRVISAMTMKDIESYGLAELDPRELFVIVRRMGLDREPKQRLSAIGEMLNLSREAVRQIESKARGKLAHPVILRKLVREGRP